MSQMCKAVTSNNVRRIFLDYFSQHPSLPHVIAKSTKVAPPTNDPTLPFVNAGMNAFKRVFLGQAKPPGCLSLDDKSSVANSQKCVRVGGKHNDLECVGTDGSHHTFFEMLGNWAFNQAYFKKEACSMAWQLLTGPYKLPKEKLYVTYFGGSDQLGPDLETRDIWRGLGLEDSHILPFGAKDNFWEMGVSGPCGPCTEIHYDHRGIGPGFVNAGRDDLVEIWNLVFMEFDRKLDGSLSPLPRKHVDTGMGLERLTAVLNGKTSNYDTDLFQTLFNVITKQSGAPKYGGSFNNKVDTNYRILSDHARMLSVCLSDGMFPESSPKLKQVLRRSLRLAKHSFLQKSGPRYNEFHLLSDLCKSNAEILGDFYPELVSNLSRVNIILEFETETLKQLESEGKKLWPNLVKEYPKAVNLVELSDCKQYYEGLKFLDKHNVNSVISGELAYAIYDSLGLREDDIETLASIKGLTFQRDDFREAFGQAKAKSKLNTALKNAAKNVTSKLSSIKPTDDFHKYNYSNVPEANSYEFPVLHGAKILALTGPEFETMDVLKKGDKGILFLDKTTFYSESGGQVGDTGEIVTESGNIFVVTDCQVVGSNHIAHIGHVKRGRFSSHGGRVEVKINPETRIKTMQAHSCTHLLNAVLHEVLPLTCQKSSLVSAGQFKFDFAVFKQDIFGPDTVHLIEEKVNRLIASRKPVTREILDSSQRLSKYESGSKTLITIPGECYPEENLSMIHTPISVEPCCGTHVFNTGDIQGFVIVGLKSLSSGVRSLRCVVGSESADIRQRGITAVEEVSALRATIHKLLASEFTNPSEVDSLSRKLTRLSNMLSDIKSKIPYTVRVQLTPVVTDMLRDIKACNRSSTMRKMEVEMMDVMKTCEHLPFIVHMFSPEVTTAKNILSKVTRLCKDKPVLVVAPVDGDGIVARACVPPNCCNEHFVAELWLKTFADFIGGNVAAPKGQDPRNVVNMKIVQKADKVSLDKALLAALEFVDSSVNRKDNRE